MAAATVGRFVGTRARLVGARVESAEQRMEAIGLHAQFGGFAQPLRPPSPSSPPNLSRCTALRLPFFNFIVNLPLKFDVDRLSSWFVVVVEGGKVH